MTLFVTFSIAVILHGLLLFGVFLKLPVREQKAPTLMDVTLITQPAPRQPKDASVLAAQNQLASKTLASTEEQVARQKRVNTLPPPAKVKAVKKIATPIDSVDKPVTREQVKKADNENSSPPRLSPELLQQQISQLATDVRNQTLQTTAQRVKFIDAISAHKYVAAQYLKDFETKVEHTGNMNYPQEAMQKDFSSTLTMDVGIRADGSIYSIRINQSSGNPALDEAAKKIVRMSAPFPALPADLLKEVDVLIITRVWRFSDQSGITTAQ